MEETNIGSLFARIAKISGELGAIAKSGKHEQNYKYHSADDVMGHLNPLMAQYGLAVIPSVLDVVTIEGQDGIQRWLIRYEFTIGDADGNVMKASWSAEAPMFGKRKDGGTFTDDKSMGKAHTYGLKYFLMKLFMVSTVDTDDLDTNSADKGESGKPAKKQQKPVPDKLSPEAHGLAGASDKMKLLKEFTKPLYDDATHQDNSIGKMLRDGILKDNMNADTAAAYVFMHKAGGKELGFDENDVKAALEMSLGEFLKRNPRNYAKAWQKLHEYAKSLEMPE